MYLSEAQAAMSFDNIDGIDGIGTVDDIEPNQLLLQDVRDYHYQNLIFPTSVHLKSNLSQIFPDL
jgi:hypothetical protein